MASAVPQSDKAAAEPAPAPTTAGLHADAAAAPRVDHHFAGVPSVGVLFSHNQGTREREPALTSEYRCPAPRDAASGGHCPGAARVVPFGVAGEHHRSMTFRITELTAAHADEVLAVYQSGIDEGNATFETRAPSWAAFDAARLPGHRLVALDDDGALLGWATVAAVSARSVYAGVVEHSVYVRPRARGRGVGSALLAELIRSTEAAGIWTVQSGIFPENTASLALHERAGFRVIGVRSRIGRHHGVWRDVVLVERRSPVVE